MSPAVQITFFRYRAPVYTTQFTDGLELGRRNGAEPPPFTLIRRDGSPPRLVAFDEPHHSRRHCTIRVSLDPRLQIVVQNHSANPIRFQTPSLRLAGGETSPPLDLPVRIWFPEHNPVSRKWDRVATIEPAQGGKPLSAVDIGLDGPSVAETAAAITARTETSEMSRPEPTTGPAEPPADPPPVPQILAPDADKPGQITFDRATFEVLLRGLAAIGPGDVFAHITKTAELLFPQAAAGLIAADGRIKIHPPGMTVPGDTLLRRLGHPPAASYVAAADLPPGFVGPDAAAPVAVLLVPIVNDARRQTHTLYVAQLADPRNVPPAAARERITSLGTLLETVLAVEVEAFERKRAQIKLLREFLPTKFAAEVLRNPAKIDVYKAGIPAPVSVLFCDIRGSSAIAADPALPPAVIDDWRGAVLELVKRCVAGTGGDVFDTQGDSVAAVWYSLDRPTADHAGQACRAAAAILAGVRGLHDAWKDRLRAATAVGIGIATGDARLNLGKGSIFRKFGPDGHVVNLAARVEGATRHLSVAALVCDDTAKLAPTGGDVYTLRLIAAQVRLAGIPDPQTLFVLTPGDETVTPVLVLPGK